MKGDNASILIIDADRDDIIQLNAQKEKLIDTPPTLEELMTEQALAEYCRAASLNVCDAGFKFNADQRRLHAQKSIVNDSIQIVEPTSLWARILYLVRHPLMAGHTGQRQIYETMRRLYYRPHMVNDAYTAIPICGSSVQKGSRHRHRRPLKLFIVPNTCRFIEFQYAATRKLPECEKRLVLLELIV